MQCVSYDAAFQRNLSETFPTWVPPPKSKSEKKKSGREKQNPTQASKMTSKKRKREDVQTTDSENLDDNEDINPENHKEAGDSGPIYITRGTRSRPIQVLT